jgi:hypothetical protein
MAAVVEMAAATLDRLPKRKRPLAGPRFLRPRYGQGCRPAVEAKPALPVVELVPELGLLPEVILLAEAAPLALGLDPELELPIAPDEPEPEAAVFSFGCPVALSRQWVAGDTEEEPELVPDELGD